VFTQVKLTQIETRKRGVNHLLNRHHDLFWRACPKCLLFLDVEPTGPPCGVAQGK